MTLPQFVSNGSGKPMAFNDNGWGGPSHSYIILVKNLKKKFIDEIIKRAKAFSRATCTNNKVSSTGTSNPMVINDYHSNLVDESVSKKEDNDDDCKFSYLKLLILSD